MCTECMWFRVGARFCSYKHNAGQSIGFSKMILLHRVGSNICRPTENISTLSRSFITQSSHVSPDQSYNLTRFIGYWFCLVRTKVSRNRFHDCVFLAIITITLSIIFIRHIHVPHSSTKVVLRKCWTHFISPFQVYCLTSCLMY